MKIALITIHNANNYGAVLQAYATKKILSQYGETSTIDYENRFLNHHLDILRFDMSVHGIKKLVHDILRFPYRLKAIGRFKNFIKSNMNLTQKLSADGLMQGKAGKFDIYICGSDQIWNPEIVSEDKFIDPIFFLSFANKGAKKLSYASSTGHHNYTDKEKKELAKLLEDFNLITTRESDGVKKLQEILPNRDIHHVLDPTLLLSKEEWLEALDIKLEEPKEKYILVYSVPRTELIRKAIDYYAYKLNMKVVAIDQMLFPLSKKIDTHIKDAGPKEFIELYANASFVITDSFHGTCFAVNFGKPFVSISAGKRANRIISLLSILNINERLVNSEEEFAIIKTDTFNMNILKKLVSIRQESLILLDEFI
ncbi:Polysaccharide pyruvyl transferase [Thiovulum sp. ES]|nr:Polysaccharide pyruvyl transferase [Thiovulum sp. ES]